MTNQRLFAGWRRAAAVIALAAICGCESFQPQLASDSGVTLQDIADLQNNPALTDLERAEALRASLGLEDNPEDNQVIIFLLSLQLPARGQPIPLATTPN